MKCDFDQVIDRSGNRASKYDERVMKFGTDKVIPLWVADMDFKTAQPIIDACVKKAEEGIWGYTSRPASYFEAVKGWEKRRNNWDVDTSLMSWSLGVVPALSVLVKIFSHTGDKVMIQTPVYSEFYDVTEAWEREVVENKLVEENGRLVPAVGEVTVKDLLGMTSGLMYNGNPGLTGAYVTELFRQVDERLLTDQAMTTAEIAGALGKGPLAFQPGSSWLYGTSADVLGAVVEAAAGMTFGEFLKKNIFEPLEMKDTGFFVPEEKRDRLAAAYRLNAAGELERYTQNHLGIINAMDRQPAFESGGAGLVSTIDDYARFAQMLLNEGELDGRRILQPATVRFMTAGQLTQVQREAFGRNFANMPGFSYGNLMRVMVDPGQSATLNHVGEYGWDGWLGCYFANDPAAGMTMLFMMQKTDAGLTSVVRRMRNLMISSLED